MAPAKPSSRQAVPASSGKTGNSDHYPVISIVIPSYNQGTFLKQTLQSLLSQNYPSLQLIVIDGNSSDKSKAILQEHDAALDYWISEPDKGQSDALNKGFARARGKIYGWLNSDDTLQPDSLFQVAAAFADTREQMVMASHYRLIDQDGHFCQRKENRWQGRKDLIRYWRHSGMTINQPSVFFRASLFKQVNALFDTTLEYGMDYDLWLQLSKQADIRIIAGCWANYRLHGASKTGQGFARFIPEWNRISRRYQGSWFSLARYRHGADFLLWTARNTGHEPVIVQQGAAVNGSPQPVASAQPLVTVIISNYNYGRFLETAIDSVLAQTYNNLEIIAVDDGSTDTSRNVLRRYQDRITVIFQKNKGQAAAFNTAFRACSGEIICFLDADDCWQENKVAETVKKFRQEPCGTVFHDLTLLFNRSAVGQPDSPGQEQPILYSSLHKKTLIGGFLYPGFLTANSAVNFIPSSGMAISRTIGERIFPLHETGWQICADTQLAYAAACFARVGIITIPLGFYRIHGRNQYTSLQKGKPERIQVLDLVNKQRCQLKFQELSKGLAAPLVSPLANYLVLRRWLFLAAPLRPGLIRRLLQENISFFINTDTVYYKKTAMVKFFLLDLMVFFFLLFRIPCKRLRMRRIYHTEFKP